MNPTKLDSTLDVIKEFPLQTAGFAAGYHRTGPADPALEREAVELAKKADVVLLSQEGLEVRNIIMDGKLL